MRDRNSAFRFDSAFKMDNVVIGNAVMECSCSNIDFETIKVTGKHPHCSVRGIDCC